MSAGCPSGGGGSSAPAQTTPIKVLFLGNSFTSVNSLPDLLSNLAQSTGQVILTDQNAPGGNTLGSPQVNGAPHVSNATSLGLIAADAWDHVVLQEESTTPTIPFSKDTFMRPGAQSLDASIKASDPSTATLLFQTWGRRNGGQFCFDPSNCSPVFATFDEMQDAVTAAYAEVAALIGATVVPVGEAWRTAMITDPAIDLYETDDAHPNLLGSYLAACVFYATILNQSPVGAPFDAGLPPATALFLQQAAWDTVRGARPATTEVPGVRIWITPVAPIPAPVLLPSIE